MSLYQLISIVWVYYNCLINITLKQSFMCHFDHFSIISIIFRSFSIIFRSLLIKFTFIITVSWVQTFIIRIVTQIVFIKIICNLSHSLSHLGCRRFILIFAGCLCKCITVCSCVIVRTRIWCFTMVCSYYSLWQHIHAGKLPDQVDWHNMTRNCDNGTISWRLWLFRYLNSKIITSKQCKQNKFIDVLINFLINFKRLNFVILEQIINRLPRLRLKILRELIITQLIMFLIDIGNQIIRLDILDLFF